MPGGSSQAVRSGRSGQTPAAPAAGALLGIGQVLARLRADFADITPSKLRFLEEQGLVFPSRTASGYRKFSAGDVERLRMILAMQRDHYLPLKVIKAYLDEVDAGGDPAPPGGGRSASSLLSNARRLDRDELAAETGASAALVTDAIGAGFLPPSEHFGDDAVATVKALVDLGRFGIEPRHLRSVRASVEREVALIDSAIAPLTRRATGSARDQAAEVALDITEQLAVVRAALMRSALSGLRR